MQDIFDKFWGLADYNIQNIHLSSMLSCSNCKRSRVRGRPNGVLRTINYSVIATDARKLFS